MPDHPLRAANIKPPPLELKSVCVYCGSNPGSLAEYAETAFQCGSLLAEKGITLVYGGGKVGLMGAVADGALARGGRVIGVIPRALIAREVAHNGVSELHAVSSMHERKWKMAELSDAFVALPGGIGTLEEIFEVFTWNQLGIHAKPCAFLNVAGFYDHLFQFIEKMVEQRFLKSENFDSLILETNMRRLLDRLILYQHSHTDKWLDADARP